MPDPVSGEAVEAEELGESQVVCRRGEGPIVICSLGAARARAAGRGEVKMEGAGAGAGAGADADADVDVDVDVGRVEVRFGVGAGARPGPEIEEVYDCCTLETDATDSRPILD
jgi:hypothetical protein